MATVGNILGSSGEGALEASTVSVGSSVWSSRSESPAVASTDEDEMTDSVAGQEVMPLRSSGVTEDAPTRSHAASVSRTLNVPDPSFRTNRYYRLVTPRQP